MQIIQRGGRRRCALVAFMQFSRVLLVALAAAVVALLHVRIHGPRRTSSARSPGQPAVLILTLIVSNSRECWARGTFGPDGSASGLTYSDG